ncbi:glycosyl transferase [Methylogaea oryzae]|uniref:Glycosyl transferase n=2 Tax=Methylogaea oryzae TaxID=1295382 RepID=A0A8D4VMR5_9GAMM|nr:glycosyl transferase [Methylogaea oryzae]
MISIIVPIYNEAENVTTLAEALLAELDRLQRPFEIIFVNDGSADDSDQKVAAMAAKDSRVRLINLKRNFGQTAAMMAGIDHAQGAIIVPMDGDLQNDPKDIKRLIDKLDEGYDVVSGWRKNRRDPLFRRNIPSRIANRIISWISGVVLHDYGCSLKAYRREILDDVKLYGEMHRFVPLYASLNGARVAEIPVSHHPRIHGASHYGLERVIKVLLDLIVIRFLARYATKPMYVFGGFGFLSLAFASLTGSYALYLKFFENTSLILTPLPLLTAMAITTGIMSILMGLLGELLARTYHESQNKPIYRIKNTINLDKR